MTEQEKCPKKVDDEYNEGLSKRKAIYVPYAQAVPNTPVIDRDMCMHFKTGGCQVCTEFCGVGHADMTADLSVVSQQEYDVWLQDD